MMATCQSLSIPHLNLSFSQKFFMRCKCRKAGKKEMNKFENIYLLNNLNT